VGGICVVGTDTGVGKTTVACGLLRLARRGGFRLIPFKPVETGCDPFPADAERLRRAADVPELTTSDVCPVALVEPVAPSVAARLEARAILLDDLVEQGTRLLARGDALLVEGAGGLLTPYGPRVTVATLAERLGLDVLIVAANRLGTINHTALTYAEVTRRRLRCAGIVLVDVSPTGGPDRASNADEIAALTERTPLGTLRFCPSLDPDAIADAVARDVDLRGLFDGRLDPLCHRPLT